MKKILIVDDNIDILTLVTVVLKRQGFIVHGYSIGLKVLEVVSEIEPDLILLDINLPGKSGVEICKEIKQKLNVPVILLSAHADKVKSLDECKADAFVEKPFEIDNLIKTINLHLT